MQDRLIHAKEHIIKAKDELVQAAMDLNVNNASFKRTIKKIMETIGDLVVAEKVIDTHLDR